MAYFITAILTMLYLVFLFIKSFGKLLIFPTIQKPYHPSPVQDSKRCGFGGLLSRLAVHAASRDEEDSSSAEIGTGGERKEKFWCVSL